MPLHLQSRSYTSTPQHLIHRRSHQEQQSFIYLNTSLSCRKIYRSQPLMGSKSIIYLNVPDSFDHLIDGEHLQDQTLIATRMTDVVDHLTCTYIPHFLYHLTIKSTQRTPLPCYSAARPVLFWRQDLLMHTGFTQSEWAQLALKC